MKDCILIVTIMLCLFGCHKDNLGPSYPWTPDSTVHLAGNGGGGSYWKNGVYSTVGDSGNVKVQSMSVNGSTVLIGGWNWEGNVIWKNGEQTIVDTVASGVTLVAAHGDEVFGIWTAKEWVLFRNGTTTPISKTGWPTAMALHGEDVYIAGASQGNEYAWGVSSFYPLDTYAIAWKNELEIFRETAFSYANAIFILHDDIYLGGHLNHYPSLDVVACYWKNGERFTLTDESQNAEVNGLFVTDTHVYATGVINDQAVYWKDGAAIQLSDGVTTSVANSIAVLGTDVYVAGQEGKYPAVWKNGIKQNIQNQNRQGEIKVIVVVQN